MTSTPPSRLERIELLSRKFHDIYQKEIRRQGQVVRHADNYDALSENTKELDRVLARYFLDNMEPLEAEARAAEKMRGAIVGSVEVGTQTYDGVRFFHCPFCMQNGLEGTKHTKNDCLVLECQAALSPSPGEM